MDEPSSSFTSSHSLRFNGPSPSIIPLHLPHRRRKFAPFDLFASPSIHPSIHPISPTTTPDTLLPAFAVTKSKRMCAILLDTKGPEIRSGKLKDGQDIILEAGQDFELFNDFDYIGDNKRV